MPTTSANAPARSGDVSPGEGREPIDAPRFLRDATDALQATEVGEHGHRLPVPAGTSPARRGTPLESVSRSPGSPSAVSGMRVLVVTSTPPLAEGTAAGRCAVGLLKGLRSHGVDVRVLSPRRAFDPAGRPAIDGVPVEVVPVTSARANAFTRQMERIRRPAGGLAVPEMLEPLRDLSATVDVVHLDEVEASWGDLAAVAPTVAHLHYRAHLDQPMGAPWSRGFRTAGERRAAEWRAVRRHGWLLANSPRVAATFRLANPRAEVRVAPLTLDADGYRPASLTGPPVAGILGTAAWPPTARAIDRLVRRVWPLVRRRCPEAVLRIAGRGTADLGYGNVRGVEVVGEVPSASNFLQGLSCLVYPLERGSGMKVKVLESLAIGLPVVTGAEGAEGFPNTAGIVVERTDEGIAAQTVALLSDPAQRRVRGAAAYALFAERYAPGPATAPLVELYAAMREAGRTGAALRRPAASRGWEASRRV